jgi:hypothetical protein
LAYFNGVISICKNFGFNDGHESIFLADGCISGESPCVFLDGLLGWETISDLQHCSPLGESAAETIKLGSHLGQAVQTHGGGLVTSSRDNLKTLVDLDTSNDSSAVKELDKVNSILGGLSNSL